MDWRPLCCSVTYFDLWPHSLASFCKDGKCCLRLSGISVVIEESQSKREPNRQQQTSQTAGVQLQLNTHTPRFSHCSTDHVRFTLCVSLPGSSFVSNRIEEGVQDLCSRLSASSLLILRFLERLSFCPLVVVLSFVRRRLLHL